MSKCFFSLNTNTEINGKKILIVFRVIIIIITYKTDETVSNKTILKPAGSCAHEDFGVTHFNNSVIHGFPQLNVEKAQNKIDRKSLNTFNVFV